MLAYKGFTKDLTAALGSGNYQFEIGVKAETEKAKCASTGFHCAEDPLDVLDYYSGPTDRYCIVKAEGDIHEDAHGSRISCTSLTPVKEITRQQLAAHACDYMYRHPNRETNKAVAEERGKADNYFAIVRGKNPIAKGRKGTVIFLLSEARESREIIGITALEIDGKQYKENVYYDSEGKEVSQ